MARNFLKSWETVAEGLLWLVLITPLVVTLDSAIFPFVFPKALYAQLTIGLLLVAMVPLFYFDTRYRQFNKAFTLVLGLYALALALSGWWGVDHNRSFWGNYERMTGIIFIWSTMVYAFLVAQFYRVHPERMRRLLDYSLVVASVVAMTGIIQYFDSTFLMRNGDRVAGVFGNPIYLGGYCAVFLLITLYLFFTSKARWWRGWYVVVFFLLGTAAYMSGTRSAVLGLVAAGGLWFLWFLWQWWKKGEKKRALLVAASSLVLLSVFVTVVRLTPSLRETSLYRLTSIYSGVTTASTRLIAWEAAIKGWQERPVLGWGPENFFYVFNKFFQGKSLLFGAYETWFDHAHNALFDVLVTQGLVGIVIYLSQYAVLWYLCFQRRGDGLLRVLGLILVVHFVHNIFVFDHPSSYVLFYLLAGLIVARAATGENLPASVTAPSAPSRYSAGVVAAQAVVLLLTLYLVVPSWRQNYYDAMAQMTAASDMQRSVQYFQQSLAVNGPHDVDVLTDVGRTVQSYYRLVPEKIAANRTVIEFAVQSVDQALLLQPDNVLSLLLQGQLYTMWFEAGELAAAYKADDYFQRALAINDQRQQVYTAWARLKFLGGQPEAGQKLLQQAIDIEPQAADPHWYLAVMIVDRNPALALAELQKSMDLGKVFATTQELYIAGRINENNGLYPTAASYYIKMVEAGGLPLDKEFLQHLDDVFVKAKRPEWQARLHKAYPTVFKK